MSVLVDTFTYAELSEAGKAKADAWLRECYLEEHGPGTTLDAEAIEECMQVQQYRFDITGARVATEVLNKITGE